MIPPRDIDLDGLAARIETLPGFAAVRVAAVRSGVPAYIVGGAVRDALIGVEPLDLDLVAAGDPIALAEALDGEIRTHERFCTATVATPEGPVNIAAARTESYAYPGALPDVHPAAGIDSDLARRDFTVNAIAVDLDELGVTIDPHGGVDDLAAGLLRVLHPASFADDPTRALRAARYSARLGLELEPQTLELLRKADLTTVSRDRVDVELRRLAAEADPRLAFELLSEWDLITLTPEAGERIDAVVALVATEPWAGAVDREELVLAAAGEPSPAALELAASESGRPSIAVAAAGGHDMVTLAIARIIGAAWLDGYVSEWSRVKLEISGSDLIAAGVPEGPALGRGLGEALRAKLDGETSGREDELRVALEAATG